MKDLKILVYEEARNLLIHATKEERSMLDFERLDGGDPEYCIYGQMTGNCFRRRSIELLDKCTKPYSSWVVEFIGTNNDSFFNKPIGRFRDFSPIEFFIYPNRSTEQERKELIDYLKKDLL